MKEKRNFGEGAWLSRIDSPAWRAWSGYAFENICFMHIGTIKIALGMGGVYTEISSWSDAGKGVQVDLLIDRRDHVNSLCEIKFSQDPYSITKTYRADLEKKISAFRTVTKTRKSVFLTMITTFGLFLKSRLLCYFSRSILRFAKPLTSSMLRLDEVIEFAHKKLQSPI